jgi:hypothetical protein
MRCISIDALLMLHLSMKKFASRRLHKPAYWLTTFGGIRPVYWPARLAYWPLLASKAPSLVRTLGLFLLLTYQQENQELLRCPHYACVLLLGELSCPVALCALLLLLSPVAAKSLLSILAIISSIS